MKSLALFAMTLMLCASVTAPTRAADSASPTIPNNDRRGKALNFEGSVVEGMNKNPMNSVENNEKLDGRRRPHLYKKREHYRTELKRSAKETGYTP